MYGVKNEYANFQVRAAAKEYMQSRGERLPIFAPAKLDKDKAIRIAQWYDETEEDLSDPIMKMAYEAFASETRDQLTMLNNHGFFIREWEHEGQPYANSAEMMLDLALNQTIMVYTGGEKHPMLSYYENFVFRGVHDIFGHAMNGCSFGPSGEENAWRTHKSMYSGFAQKVMTSETRGQNSWVNYGPFGQHNRSHPEETVYAEQKAIVAPDWVIE